MLFFLRVIIACLIGSGLGWAVRSCTSKPPAAVVVPVAPVPTPTKTPTVDSVTSATVAAATPPVRLYNPKGGDDAQTPADKPAWPTGTVVKGETVIVVMSDGTIRWQNSKFKAFSDGIEAITPSSVTIAGEKQFIKPARPIGGAAPVDGAVPSDTRSTTQRWFPRPIWKGRDKDGEFEAPYYNAGNVQAPPPIPPAEMVFGFKK